MKVAVIDGLGGGLGAQIVEKLNNKLSNKIDILALGTNAVATSKMLEQGADEGATGENAIKLNVNKVDLIIGPLGLIIPNSMKGEITTVMAEAIAGSDAKKIILGMRQPHVDLVGLSDKTLNELIDDSIKKTEEFLKGK
ncbi:MAG TPA: DUF3842 family protein [Halanaerobiales bacterium]|nr:DUF3842 family protein [Halanaerobiales bacterium]